MGSLKTDEDFPSSSSEEVESILYVNGVRRVLPDGLAHLTLLEYLRDIGLTGTKLGCGEGGCGACTVMVSDYDQSSKRTLGKGTVGLAVTHRWDSTWPGQLFVVNQVPNASPTAASASSDIYGAAVLDACEQIKARMEPIASKRKHTSFAELARACYVERIDLSAHGFHIIADIDFDWKTGKGNPYRYFTYGAAFAEVEIDTLTGDFHTRTADIILDLGYSLNPAIDIGQIEGAFIQGLGWVALEEVKWGDAEHKWVPPGYLYTCGPGNYKIPTTDDIPHNFRVSLLKGNPNVKAVHSSKAVGEPPFFLASSVFFAIKDAISAARDESGHSEWFPLDNPATPERIRMACIDDFTKPFAGPDYRPKLSV